MSRFLSPRLLTLRRVAVAAALTLLAGLLTAVSGSASADTAGPRALFGAADVPALRAKIETEPGAAWWRTVEGRANAALGRDVATTCERQLRYDLPDLALSYLVSGDQRYGDKAAEVLVGVSDAPRWHPESEDAGCRISWGDYGWRWPQLVAQTAFAYDWMRGSGLLSAQDEAKVQADIAAGARIIYDALRAPEYSGAAGYRNLTNYRLRNDAGLGIAGLVLSSVGVDGEPKRWADYAWEDLFGDTGRGTPNYFRQMITSDGVYKEGQSYYQDSLRLVTPYFVAAKRLAGKDAFADPAVHATYNAAVRTALPSGDANTVDSGWLPAAFSSGFGHWVAGQYPDEPWHLWAWQREGQPAPAGDQFYALIFYRPDLSERAAAPSESPTQFLPEGGYAVLRSDWGADARMLLLNSEHVPDRSPHEQPDQTSFSLHAYGAYLAVDPGDGRNCGVEGDRWVRSAAAHNLVLVDGKGPRVVWDYETVPDPAKLVGAADTAKLDYARAAMTYSASDVDTTRTALMVRDEYYVVTDRLSGEASHQYDWQIHYGDNPAAQLTLGENSARFTTPNADGEQVALDTYVDAPDGATWHRQTGLTNMIPGSCRQHPYLQVRSEGAEAAYSSVLYPRRADAAAPQIGAIEASGARATTIDAANRHDVVLVNRSGRTVTADSVLTDADLGFVSRGDGVESFLVEQGRGLTVDGRRYLSASRAVNAVVSYTDDGVQARIDAAGETRLVLATGDGRPVSVYVDGRSVPYDRVAGGVALTVPGSVDLRVVTR